MNVNFIFIHLLFVIKEIFGFIKKKNNSIFLCQDGENYVKHSEKLFKKNSCVFVKTLGNSNFAATDFMTIWFLWKTFIAALAIANFKDAVHIHSRLSLIL